MSVNSLAVKALGKFCVSNIWFKVNVFSKKLYSCTLSALVDSDDAHFKVLEIPQ